MRCRPGRTLGGIVAVALTLGGCSDTNETKAGGTEPVTLRLAIVDPPGRPASDDVEEFARQVEELSGGTLRVEILWEAHERVVTPEDAHPYRAAIELVSGGDAEIGLVPDGSWSEVGVTSLQALKAPFLITNEALAEAISTGDMADDMLAGLADAGMVGLALLPETLRHPVGFERAFRGLPDFDGSRLRVLDQGTATLLAALGAESIALNGSAFGRAVIAGEVDGADSAFGQVSSLPRPGTFTANITFQTKFNVLFAAADALDRLPTEQRTILLEAADRTLNYVLQTNPTDAESAQEYCERGGSVVVANDADVTAIEQAASPVYQDLEGDKTTRAMIRQIRDLKQALHSSSPAVTACDPHSGTPPAETTTPQPDSATLVFPEGIYRMEMPAEFLIAAGIDETTANDHAGIWTLHFEDGKFLDPSCPGSTYSVTGSRVSIVLGKGPGCGDAAGGELFSAEWTLEGDVLQFTNVRSGVEGPAWQHFHETLWGGKPWTKIG